jgi:hypothetical protein
MTSRGAADLALHGLLVLFLGLLCGIPFGSAIVSGWGDDAVRAWKLAPARQQGIVVWGAILAAWGNVIGAMIGALTGYRGLAPEGPLANWLVFLAFMFGMWGVLLAVPVAAAGVLAWRRDPRNASAP